MKREEIESFVKNLVTTIWEKHELDKLSQFYSSQLEGFYNDDRVDFEALKKKVKIFHDHMKNVKIEIIDLVIEGSKFCLYANQCVDSTGKAPLIIPTILLCHMKDNKICKYWLKTEMPLEFS